MAKPDNQHNSEGLGGTVFEFPKGKPRKQPEPEPQPTTPTLDLMQHIPECSFKHYVSDVARMTKVTVNTSLLVGLGIVSSVAARCRVVSYENGTGIQPLGLYVLAEHDSGTGKSYMLSTYQAPIFSAAKALDADWQRRKKAAEEAKEDFTDPFPYFSFDTDASPEGLDKSLADTNGHFSLASSEKGLANSISGASYGEGRTANQDLWLKGYNAEFHSSKRSQRGGYRGRVVGSVVNIAQPGLVQTILTQSNNSGAAERCLMLSEKSLLGKRKHGRQYRHYPDQFTQNTYNRIVEELTKHAAKNETVDKLPNYRLSTKSWDKIAELKDEFESNLADGGKYSTQTLRSIISKADITIMKLSANLAVIDECLPGEIPEKWVDAALGITRDMLNYTYHLLVELDVIGTNAFEDSVIEYLGKKGQATRRQIDQAKRKTKPWAEVTPKKAIGGTLAETIDGLILKGIVGESEEFDSGGNSKGRLLRLVA